MIPRNEYLNFLIRSKDKQIIKVISGVRRCGKSTLFELYQEYLLKNKVSKSQIIYINFEDIDYEHLKNYRNLYDHIVSLLINDKMNYIFLDEIQHVPMFEKCVDSLFIKKNTDIHITGSNAYFMSGELATMLSGRYVELKMLPLSFKEYCIGNTENKPSKEKYRDYLENSSFPYTLQYGKDKKAIRDYLESLYSTVILKDVAIRYKISDIMMLESVTKFIFGNIGSKLSITKIANTMKSNGRKIDPKTVEKFVRALSDSLLIYQAKRYDVKGKQYLRTLEKYYAVDIGLRYMLLGGRGADQGHILENIVYLELLRRGYDVYVGQADNLEIDFAAMNEEGIHYYQVSASVRDENTLQRELASLQKISDHYPKFILALDEDPASDYNGIKRINAIDWLLDSGSSS